MPQDTKYLLSRRMWMCCTALGGLLLVWLLSILSGVVLEVYGRRVLGIQNGLVVVYMGTVPLSAISITPFPDLPPVNTQSNLAKPPGIVSLDLVQLQGSHALVRRVGLTWPRKNELVYNNTNGPLLAVGVELPLWFIVLLTFGIAYVITHSRKNRKAAYKTCRN